MKVNLLRALSELLAVSAPIIAKAAFIYGATRRKPTEEEVKEERKEFPARLLGLVMLVVFFIALGMIFGMD